MAAKGKIRTYRVRSVTGLETQLNSRLKVMDQLIKDVRKGAVVIKTPDGGSGTPLQKARQVQSDLKRALKAVDDCCSDNTLGATFITRK